MSKAIAKVTQVEEATARNGKVFYRVHLEDGSTLYTYSSRMANAIVEGQSYEFELNQQGRYVHISNLTPATDVNADMQDDYPSDWDEEEHVPKAKPVGTTFTNKPIGTTSPPRRTYSGNWNKSQQAEKRNPNASFAISYAKDIEVAFIASGDGFDGARFESNARKIHELITELEG